MAEENSSVNQARYTHRYNLRSKNKTFEVDDPVIILMKDSSNKLMQRWIGPTKIRAKVSPNSYEVECDDGSVKRLQANHLRAYHERVNAGLVFENDEEFGDLECVPIKLDDITETLDVELNLEHLNSDQRRDVLRKLQKNEEVFSDRPGLCDPEIAEYVITVKMKEEDWPKQKKPYQVPPILRSEIERQIKNYYEME